MLNQLKGMAFGAYDRTTGFVASAYSTTTGFVASAYGTTTGFVASAYGTTTGFVASAYGTTTGFVASAYGTTTGFVASAYGTLASYVQRAKEATYGAAVASLAELAQSFDDEVEHETAFLAIKGSEQSASASASALSVLSAGRPPASAISTIPRAPQSGITSVRQLLSGNTSRTPLNRPAAFGFKLNRKLISDIRRLIDKGLLTFNPVEGASYHGEPVAEVTYQPAGFGSRVQTLAAIEGGNLYCNVVPDGLIKDSARVVEIVDEEKQKQKQEQEQKPVDDGNSDAQLAAQSLSTSQEILENTNNSTGNFALMGLGVALAIAGACICALTPLLAVGAAVTGVGLLVAGYGLFKQAVQDTDKGVDSKEYEAGNDGYSAPIPSNY